MNFCLLEKTYVLNVYDHIAQDFNHTRYKSWPRVEAFLNSLNTGSIVYDIGSGNGRHLLGSNIFSIGCDTCLALLQICHSKNYQVVAANVLNLPYRNESADYCTCIAVIHHLSTKERRLNAIKEIVRVLVVGGKCLIYVWAMEQTVDGQKSKYLNFKDNSLNSFFHSNDKKNLELPIHCRGTDFKQQDILVPWFTKKGKAHDNQLRYYHVFRKGELQELLESIKNIQINEIYYEEGNWCAIFTKVNTSE